MFCPVDWVTFDVSRFCREGQEQKRAVRYLRLFTILDFTSDDSDGRVLVAAPWSMHPCLPRRMKDGLSIGFSR